MERLEWLAIVFYKQGIPIGIELANAIQTDDNVRSLFDKNPRGSIQKAARSAFLPHSLTGITQFQSIAFANHSTSNKFMISKTPEE